MEKCLVKLQTNLREDPTVNEVWAAFLPRQLHVASLRSFLVAYIYIYIYIRVLQLSHPFRNFVLEIYLTRTRMDELLASDFLIPT